MLHATLVLTFITLAQEPVVGNSPLAQTQGQYYILITLVYPTCVPLGTQ